MELSAYDNDPTLYLFTSLTAGSSHIVTATSRIETILRANKIPFKGVDTATDDLARKLFQRRASGKKLPLLVKEGYVLGDLEQIEEWNEYDELHEALSVDARPSTYPAKPTPAQAAAAITQSQKENTPSATSEQNLAIRQLGAEAAKLAASKKASQTNISSTNPLLTEKVKMPAAPTPKTLGIGSPTGLLSPKMIPLPTTPLHLDSRSSSSERRSFAGADIEEATKEEIKRIEEEEAIEEVSSSEEVDSEDEREGARLPPVPAMGPATTQARVIPNLDEKKGEEEEEEEDDDDEDEDEDEEESSEEESEEDSATEAMEKLKVTEKDALAKKQDGKVTKKTGNNEKA